MLNKEHFKKWFNSKFSFTEKGTISVNGKVSQYKSPSDIATMYYKTMQESMFETDWLMSDCVNLINEMKPVKTKVVKNITHAESWVQAVLNAPYCPFRISRTGTMFEYVKQNQNLLATNADINDVLSWLRLQNDEQEKFKDGLVKDALTMVLRRANYDVLYKIAEDFTYDKKNENALNTFLKFNYDYWKIKQDYDVYETMFKHWMWCLKRKILGMNVRHHIWINLYGTTGFGKTEWFKRFTKNLSDFAVYDAGLQIFEDMTREYKKFANNYVLFFDELAINSKNGPTDASLSTSAISAIKQTVTGDIITPRIMGGQEQAKVKNRAMCFSAANWHLYDIIFDETSMRRFFEFEVGRTELPTKDDFEKLNNVLSHSIDAFKGIDENNSDGYFDPDTPTGKKIREIQRNFRPTRTTVHSWIKHNDVKIGKIKADKLYPTYKEWCKENNYNARNIDGFLEIINNHFNVPEGQDVFLDIGNKEVNKLDDVKSKKIDSFIETLTQDKQEVTEDFE